MKIVEKYLWRSVLTPLLFVIAALFTLWLTFDIFDKIGRLIDQGASPRLLVEYFLVQLPSLAQTILPIGMLFSTLYVLAYFSRHRESVALTASGVSPLVLAWPFLICSLALSVVLYGLFLELSPTAQGNRDRLKKIIGKVPVEEKVLRQVVYRSPRLPDTTETSTWFIGRLDLEANTLEQAEILIRSESTAQDLSKIFAEKGEFRGGQWHFQGVRRIEFTADGSDPVIGPWLAEYSEPALREPPGLLAVKLRPPDVLPWGDVARLAGDSTRLNQRLRAPYATENWHRLAYPLACPLLCLFGIAFGMTDARRNVAATVFSSVFVLFGFLVLTRFFVALGQGNRIPPFLAGTVPIFLFGGAGLYLFAEKMGWLWALQGWSQEHPRAALWLRRIGLVHS